MTLGLAFILPIAGLIVFDFFFWIYRLTRRTNLDARNFRLMKAPVASPLHAVLTL